MTVGEKQREIKALDNRVNALEKGLSLDKTLSKIKNIMWAKINQSITDQW